MQTPSPQPASTALLTTRFLPFARLLLAVATAHLLSLGPVRAQAPATPPAGPATEQRWIIASILGDGANLSAFAAAPERWSDLPDGAVEVHETPGTTPGESYAVTVRLPGGGEPITGELKLTQTAWSPELYGPILRAVGQRLHVPPAAGPGGTPDADLLKALATPTTNLLEAQNQKISAWLQAHPTDAAAHEQAALLLGTLALRENSGWLWNPLGLCNRAAAHLAFARALRPEKGPCGELAELLIGLIIDTKADCQARIATLQARVAAHPELGPWVTAASLRNTRDYRLLADPTHATLLERIEVLRALSESTYAAQSVNRVKNLDPAALPDWTRILLQGDYDVGSGHRYAPTSTQLEVRDLMQVFPSLAKAASATQFAAALNVPPGGIVSLDAEHHARVRVIDEGTWAQYFQRHLLHAADETYYFLRRKWGVPEAAEKFRTQAGPLLKGLTLYPLCVASLGKEDGDEFYARAADLLNQHPQWVGDGAWESVTGRVPATYARGGSWTGVVRGWFSPRLPTGTVYGFDWRTGSDSGLPAASAAEFERCYRIAPLKFSVGSAYANTLAPRGRLTVEQFRTVVGPLLAYYVPAMRREAALVENDPDQYGAIMSRAGNLNPNYYLSLGKHFVGAKLPDRAAEAYQAAIDHDADPVSVSSESGWLVNYYYEHGQTERAMTLARQGAEVYSAGGLRTLAALLERTGKLKEAETYYQAIKERYDDPMPLQLFHARTSGRRPADVEELKALEAKLYPHGVPEVTLPQLTGKPAKGVLIREESDLTRKFGLKAGSVIVALDGKRVENTSQYAYIRALTTSPEMDLLVYQDDRYQAIHASAPERMLRVEIANWFTQE